MRGDKKKIIVGFMGKAGAGKTTAALELKRVLMWRAIVKSFATPLKKAVKDLFLFSDEQVYGTYEQKTAVDPRWGVSPRQVMQVVGTDCVRNMVDADFWVKRMLLDIDRAIGEFILIDDVRFVDDAEMVLNRGGILIAVRRPELDVEDSHASENPPYAMATHEIVNDSSIEAFNAVVYTTLKQALEARCK